MRGMAKKNTPEEITTLVLFLQGTGRNKKLAERQVGDCTKPVVKAQLTSNLAQYLDAHHKGLPAYAERVREDAHASVGKAPAEDKGILAFLHRNESAVP